MPVKRARSRSAAPRRRLEEAAETLRPEVTRPKAIAALEQVFREGIPPDPAPEGFLRGRLIATTTWAPLDAFGRWMAARWMPWQGKSFDPASGAGVNRFTRDVRSLMGAFWPSYQPIRSSGEFVEAFAFGTRLESGAVDPDTRAGLVFRSCQTTGLIFLSCSYLVLFYGGGG